MLVSSRSFGAALGDDVWEKAGRKASQCLGGKQGELICVDFVLLIRLPGVGKSLSISGHGELAGRFRNRRAGGDLRRGGRRVGPPCRQ